MKEIDYAAIELRILLLGGLAKLSGKPVFTARQSPTGRTRNYRPELQNIPLPPIGEQRPLGTVFEDQP